MFGLSGGHLLVLGIIVLLFGSRRLPELGSSMGKAIHSFKTAMEGKNVSQNASHQLEDHQNQESKKM